MQWNDLDHETQLEVLDRLGDTMLQEKNERLQFAMAAALVELEMWSNSPIIERTTHDIIVMVEPDPFCEKGWDE